MENKEITNIQKLTAEDKERLINELNQNEDFIKLNNELNQKGYEKQNTEFLLEENKTKIKVSFSILQMVSKHQEVKFPLTLS